MKEMFLQFKKSSFSGRSGRCVCVAITSNNIIVKNSKNIRPQLLFTFDEWDAFLKGVKAGEFDLNQ